MSDSNNNNNNTENGAAVNETVDNNTGAGSAVDYGTVNGGAYMAGANAAGTDGAESGGRRRSGPGMVAQLIIIAILSAILGGAVTGSFFYFIAPEIGSGYADRLSSGSDGGNSEGSGTISGGGSLGVSDNGNNTGTGSSDSRTIEITGYAESLVSAIAQKASPSVVGIRATPASTNASLDFSSFFYGNYEASPSEGSGIIISKDGYIVTNNHVIESALDNSGALSSGAKIEVFLPNQVDKPYAASVVGWDRKTDLAVLKIEGDNFHAAELGNSENLKIGEMAVAIGNPGGIEYMGSVTAGVISGLNREIQTEDGKDLRYIQTDAAINPGNSGGALLNSKGQLIGINTVKVIGSAYEGLGFAIPINTAKDIVDSLINNTYIKGRAPVLGIQSTNQYTEAIAKRYGWPAGVYVVSVSQFTGAYTAGIRENDIITKFEGKQVKTLEDLNVIKNEHQPGDVVEVEVYRIEDKKYYTYKVTLTEDRG